MDNLLVVFEDMPCGIRSFVRDNLDGTYTIVINARLGSTEQQKAYVHELRHIKAYDLDRFTTDQVDCVETIAHLPA